MGSHDEANTLVCILCRGFSRRRRRWVSFPLKGLCFQGARNSEQKFIRPFRRLSSEFFFVRVSEGHRSHDMSSRVRQLEVPGYSSRAKSNQGLRDQGNGYTHPMPFHAFANPLMRLLKGCGSGFRF